MLVRVTMPAHLAVSTDESDKERELAETQHTRRSASGLLTDAEHQKATDKTPHVAPPSPLESAIGGPAAPLGKTLQTKDLTQL